MTMNEYIKSIFGYAFLKPFHRFFILECRSTYKSSSDEPKLERS
jgi:hypothetical protein